MKIDLITHPFKLLDLLEFCLIVAGDGQWEPDLPPLPGQRLQAGCSCSDLQVCCQQ